jgi:hypothetical protein
VGSKKFCAHEVEHVGFLLMARPAMESRTHGKEHLLQVMSPSFSARLFSICCYQQQILDALAGWLRVTAAAISLPGRVERSHAEALATGNAFARKSPPHPILAQCRLAASKNLRSEAGTSSYSMKRRRTSSAISTVASAFGGVEGDDAHRVFVLPCE